MKEPKEEDEEEGKTFLELSYEGYANAGRSMSKGLKWSLNRLKKSLKQ